MPAEIFGLAAFTLQKINFVWEIFIKILLSKYGKAKNIKNY
jgi:hypothetical protein